MPMVPTAELVAVALELQPTTLEVPVELEHQTLVAVVEQLVEPHRVKLVVRVDLESSFCVTHPA